MTKLALESNQVFLDTEVFDSLKFNFHLKLFRKLAELVKNGVISVYLTEITVKECKAHIKNNARNVAQSSRKLLDVAYPLEFMNEQLHKDINAAFDEKLVTASWNATFDNFLKEINVIFIDTNSVSNSLIFDQYFDNKPPFGPKDKKHEFPDAFVIESLRNYLGERRMYVISRDKGWKDACIPSGPLLYLKELSEFLDLCSKSDRDIKSLIKSHANEIKARIAEDFQELDFWIPDADGEVIDVDLDPDSIKISNYFVVDIESDKFTLNLPVSIPFSAKVSYIQPGSESYDKEDGILVYCEYEEETLERSEDLDVVIEASLASDNSRDFSIDSVDFGNPNIEISISETKYPYK